MRTPPTPLENFLLKVTTEIYHNISCIKKSLQLSHFFPYLLVFQSVIPAFSSFLTFNSCFLCWILRAFKNYLRSVEYGISLLNPINEPLLSGVRHFWHIVFIVRSFYFLFIYQAKNEGSCFTHLRFWSSKVFLRILLKDIATEQRSPMLVLSLFLIEPTMYWVKVQRHIFFIN